MAKMCIQLVRNQSLDLGVRLTGKHVKPQGPSPGMWYGLLYSCVLFTKCLCEVEFYGLNCGPQKCACRAHLHMHLLVHVHFL